MSALIQIEYYNSDGMMCRSDQRSLPDFLDWKSIEEKVVFIRHMGGAPLDADMFLVKSQGERRLLRVSDPEKFETDAATYKEKLHAAEEFVIHECDRLGIDRTRKPRNQ